MMRKVKGIIALDLDGTLLDSDKKLSEMNRAALEKADAAGYEIVPTTGRFYNGMPEEIRQLPYIRYAITINGAEVTELETGKVIYQAQLPWQQAVEMASWLDDKRVIYDCYMDNGGWMSEAHKARIDEVVENPHSRRLLHNLRKPVPELKAFLRETQHGVQKLQFFAEDAEERLEMMKVLPELFDDIAVSTALPQNVEINQSRANKGEALTALAGYLGVDIRNTLSFGDGLNDLSMIIAAGTGIAMGNGAEEVKEAADWIAPTNDEDGVAAGINRFCFE